MRSSRLLVALTVGALCLLCFTARADIVTGTGLLPPARNAASPQDNAKAPMSGGHAHNSVIRHRSQP